MTVVDGDVVAVAWVAGSIPAMRVRLVVVTRKVRVSFESMITPIDCRYRTSL